MHLPSAEQIELADGRVLHRRGPAPMPAAWVYETDDRLRVVAGRQPVEGWGRTLWVAISRRPVPPTEADVNGVARALFAPGSTVVRLLLPPSAPVYLVLLPPGADPDAPAKARRN